MIWHSHAKRKDEFNNIFEEKMVYLYNKIQNRHYLQLV